MTIAAFLLVIVAVIACYGVLKVGRGRVAAHGALVLAWRWFSGEAWHGRPVTDAGWTRRGERALTRTGHATRFWYRPRWQRAASRTGRTLAVAALLVSWLVNPLVTACVVLGCLLVAAAAGCWLVVRLVLARKHRRTWLHPLHLAAHELAGWPRAALARSWITAELDGAGAVDRAELKLTPGWPADEKDKGRLVTIASAKLGIEAPEASWRLAGPAPLLTLRHSPPPPGHVTMADLLKELAGCKDDELLIGVGKNDTVIKASLGTDSPHIAVSMGTGAGKSNLAGWLMLQMLLRGSIGIVLDAKRRLSYPWILKDGDKQLVQLPNVAYAWTTPQMHESMAWLSGELDRRGDVAFAGMDTRGQIHANVGPRVFVIAEELNLAVPRLRAYWNEVRPDDGPAKSPAFTGLGEVAFAGRQVRKHLVLVGQMLTAEATGSRDSSVKENCGIKLLSRYGPKGWRIMADDVPMPPPSDVTGRVQVVTAGKAREAQTPELDPVEARRLVLASDMALLPSDMPCRPVTVSRALVLAGGPDLRPETVTGPSPVTPGPAAVTLSEAVRLGIVHRDTTLAALRMARHRGDFPARTGTRGLAHEYDAAELTAWDMARRS